MFSIDGKASGVVKEALKHMKWEPTRFMGLSLKLKVRLPCLCKFLFLSIEEERRKGEQRKKWDSKKRESDA